MNTSSEFDTSLPFNVSVICQTCRKKFLKKRSEMKRSRSGHSFCSRSCSAKYTNSKDVSPKREQIGSCKICNCKIAGDRTYCTMCFNKKKIDWNNLTYAEVKGLTKYQRNSIIRSLARKTYAGDFICQKCGYDKHVEICHIKGISNHSDATLVCEINKAENLIALCPNCHWELDNL